MSHLVIDDKNDRPEFLNEIFYTMKKNIHFLEKDL